MNTHFRPLALFVTLGLLLALSLGPAPAILAQAAPVPEVPPAESPAVPEAPAVAEAPTIAATPEAPAAAVEPAAPADPAPAAATEPLRRLDEVESVPTAEAGTADQPAEKPEAPAPKPRKVRRQYDSAGEFPLGDHTVTATQTVREVVSILGSTLVEGKVTGEAVAILGRTTVNGTVGGEAVSVLGSTIVNGAVNGETVAVLGNVTVNGRVDGQIVAVLGNVELGPKAEVKGEIVVVGGRLKRDPGAVVEGNVQQISFLGGGAHLDRLTAWVHQCLRWGRPLAFGDNLGWAWMIAIGVFAFYVLLALLFPRAFEKCAETLEQRPGHSLLAVLLTVLITPVLIVLLVITGVGLLLIPFLAAGLFFAGIFGKAVMHAWLGRRITRYFGPGPMAHVATATLIGSILVLGLYTVPFLGFFVWKVLDVIGLGVVVYTLILTMRREKPTAVPPAGGLTATAALAAPTGLAAVPPPAMAFAAADATAEGVSPVVVPPPLPPPPMAGAVLPRAGFWIRLAASAIDAALIGLVTGFTNLGGSYPLVFAVYCVVLWALKGTTVGGIVCGLKVVRLDDRKVDWAVAVVRGLGGFLSLFVAGLGFLWVAFDPERQSWHDKIAGTTVVHVPKGASLI